jgi:hypothetical protein
MASCAGGLALHFSCWDQAEASRTVGGSATPAARIIARLAAGRGVERTVKRLPSCSISVSVSESRSAMISGQEPERPSAAMRSSSAFFSNQGKEAAEHVAADGLVELVEDRPGREQVLGGAKGLLHRPQLLVAEHGFERVEIGVGAQDEARGFNSIWSDLIGFFMESII